MTFPLDEGCHCRGCETTRAWQAVADGVPLDDQWQGERDEEAVGGNRAKAILWAVALLFYAGGLFFVWLLVRGLQN